MAVKLQVPEQYADSLAELTRFSTQEIESLLKSLREEKPTLELDELANSIADRLARDQKQVYGILRLLSSLQMAREGFGTEVEEFVAELRSAMEASGKESLRASDWASFEAGIKDALAADTALSISAKALAVGIDHARTYCTSRVLTDLRPIFKNDVSQAPATMVAIHTLKLAYHEGEERKEFYVALDRTDLKQLIAQLERAILKEESLRSMATEKGFAILEVNA